MPDPRPWTARERDWLRSVWRVLPTRTIAERLNRSVASIRASCRRFCGVRRRNGSCQAHAQQIRDLHAQGHSASEIARRCGLSAPGVTAWMHKHRLKPHGITSETALRTYHKTWREQSLAETRIQIDRAKAALRGWPQARASRQADVLDLLERGPLTSAALAKALEITENTARYLASDMRRLGLIVSERTGPDGRAHVHRLADGVRRHCGERKHDDECLQGTTRRPLDLYEHRLITGGANA